MTKTIKFTKMHGLGNDFIVINNWDLSISLSQEEVIALCDRNFGIGADGLMMLQPPIDTKNDISWFFVNSDGSIPEMCGNGSRCIALFAKSEGVIDEDQAIIWLETLAGVMAIDTSRPGFATVNMGTAQSGENPSLTTLKATQNSNIVDATIEIDSSKIALCGPALDSLKLTFVSMGNPHAVIFADEVGLEINDETLNTIGPIIENHKAFPARTNVEFVSVISRSKISMRVFERGVGETLACGTGACASAYAAYLKGYVDEHVTVELLGGELQIEIKPDAKILMTGPATEVFVGTVTL